jgi:hypothetical protein
MILKATFRGFYFFGVILLHAKSNSSKNELEKNNSA